MTVGCVSMTRDRVFGGLFRQGEPGAESRESRGDDRRVVALK